ncbi:MAG: alanine dehydrogenase [Planctomycetes bacterium]|nr:alanine dehydrogenase [Planctomycetota bacterium]
MKIGVIKEIKTHEYRVGLTPSCGAAYVSHGHVVMVEAGAGVNAGFEDDEYAAAGAQITADKKEIFDACEMIIKVKEPVDEEYGLFHPGQILYTYLHLAANLPLAQSLMASRVNAVAYETIETEDQQLPCLKPMSEIAGRLSIQEGAKYLEKPFGGRGILLGGVPGVKRGNIVIIGGGVVGINACKMAIGCGANVTILDISSRRLEYFDDIFGSSASTLYSTEKNIYESIIEADVVIGAVLLPGAKAPKLVKREHLKDMKKGAVVVDVAVDQGGCFETTKPTTHDAPIYVIDGVVHYAVANMPGAVALTSTIALTSTTLEYGLLIADNGLAAACRQSSALLKGLNIYNGKCVYQGVADSLGLDWTDPESILA